MIWLAFGRWNHAAGRWLIWDRLYYKGYVWTPFVTIRRRYGK